MLIDIRCFSVLVESENAPKLIVTKLKEGLTLPVLLKLFIKLVLTTRVASSEQRELFQRGSKRISNLTWISYGSDGSRLHFYDDINQTVGKLPSNVNLEQMRYEIEGRRRAGDLCPEILFSDTSDGFILERKVSVKSKVVDELIYFETLMLISKRVRSDRKQSVKEYLSAYEYAPHLDLIYDLAIKNGPSQVSISLCHGDLWRGNICEVIGCSPVLLDWEYCGEFIYTSDVWFFVFSKWFIKRRHVDIDFYNELSNVLSLVFEVEFKRPFVIWLHMMHLFERISNHLELGKDRDSMEIVFLESALMKSTRFLL